MADLTIDLPYPFNRVFKGPAVEGTVFTSTDALNNYLTDTATKNVTYAGQIVTLVENGEVTHYALSANRSEWEELGGSDSASYILYSTGLIGNVSLTITSGNSGKFNIAVDDCLIVDHTANTLTYTGPINHTGLTSSVMATSPVTYISIGSGGTVITSATRPTHVERRTQAFVGVLTHINNTVITKATATPVTAEDPKALLIDLADAIGAINTSGNLIEPMDNGLSIKKTAGTTFGRSVDYTGNPTAPNYKTSAEVSPVSFFTNYRKATTGVNIAVATNIDPNNYDNGTGTLQPITGDDVVVHRFYYLPQDETVVMLYGQAKYGQMNQARSRFSTESFEFRSDLSAAVFLGYFFVTANTTNLTSAFDSGDAMFLPASKFGGGGVGGGPEGATLNLEWDLVGANIILTEAHMGKSLWVTADCTITIPDYLTLPDGFNVDIYLQNPMSIVDVKTTGSNTIQEGFEFVEGGCSIVKSPQSGIFVMIGRVV